MRTDKPALIILIPGFAADEQDSVCLPAQQSFILSLNKNFPGVPLIILAFQYPFIKKEYTWNNNRIIAFGGKNKGGLSRILLWKSVDKKFKELRNEYRMLGILSFWGGECSLVAKRLSEKYELPYYCWLMGQDVKKENKYIRRIRPAASSLIAISDHSRNEFLKNHSILPDHVIPLGVSLPALKNEQRDIDLLGVGSLIPLKQFDLFINLVKDLKNIFPAVKAVICGKGSEENRLKQLIEKNNIGGNISLEGELPHSKILELMSRTKILLHPSAFEGFSGVCLEALHAGAHVLSFHKPMEHEIANWHTVNSIVQMREKLFVLLGTPLNHYAVMAYPVELAAKSVMKLFRP